MRRTILSLCVVFVLAWAAGSVLAQGQGKGKEQGNRPADRAVNPNKPGDIAKPDPNAAANAKKSLTPQDMQKGAEERAKAFRGRSLEQLQAREKAAKDRVASRIAEMKAKGQEQQARVFEKQAQHETAKHVERQARLARIRELAEQQGNTKMVEQVNQLIAKEQQLFDRKLQRMQEPGRPGTTPPPLPGVGMKSKEKVDVDKPATPTPPPAPGTSGAGGQPAPTPGTPGTPGTSAAPGTPGTPGAQPSAPKPQ